MRQKYFLGMVSVAAVLCGATAFLQLGVSADRPPENKPADGQPSDTRRLVTSEALGGDSRFLTYIATDKPVYKPGEKVYVRGVMLDAARHAPANASTYHASFQVTGPKGDIVASGMTQVQNSVAGFIWEVPAEQAGGEYKVKILQNSTGDAPAERKFEIRAYRAPRLKNQIVFVRDGYGPGDTVAATLKTERAEGGIPAGAKVTIQALVDGVTVSETVTSVDPGGLVSARFELPKSMARGEGTLAFVIEDGGIVETASKTIPILLQTIDLTLYPEGGELVAGLPNRVYLAAKTPAGKPADLKGTIVDSAGKDIATLRTEHEGRGRVQFTPVAGEKYTLRITEPAGIKSTYPLPEVQKQGTVVASTADVTSSGKPVVVRVGATSTEKLVVELRQREKVIDSKEVRVQAGEMTEVSLDAKDSDGVLVVTAWKNDHAPVAERLVFRSSRAGIEIQLTSDQASYTPGSPARLKIKTVGADGKPVAAVVGLTVTDDSVLEMIEKREQPPRLPVMVLLENEVKDLADAHVYLDPNNEKAPAAVDLLLATQGWRRFAFYDSERFLQEHGDAALRIVAMRTAPRLSEAAEFRFGGAAGFGGGRGAIRANLGGPLPKGGPAKPGAAPVPASAPAVAKPQAEDVAEKTASVKALAPRQASASNVARRDANIRNAAAGWNVEGKPQQVEPEKDRLEKAAEDGARKRLADEQIVDGRRALKAERREFAGDFESLGWIVVREFAHQARPGRKPGDRVDFTETLYWNAGVATSAETGEAEIAFMMNDAVTSFRVFADAFTSKGELAAQSIAVESVEPFYVEPKLPLEVTTGDLIELPLGIVNRTIQSLPQASLRADVKGMTAKQFDSFTLPAEARLRKLLPLTVGTEIGNASVVLSATAGPYADKVTRSISVKPLGFPIEIGKGGMLSANETKTHEIQIPGNVVPGSLTATVAVFPTPLANMTAALERLMQEPYGCFEQTSSTTYPLVMAQQYFTTHSGVDPALIEKSNGLLERGYNRLTGYECKSGGYEWFGQDPGHEALTAYGLLEFTDMASVRPVDGTMIERTRTWLANRRDGNGGFKRERRALHTWIEDKDCSNAYITWALLRSGMTDLASEVTNVRAAAGASKNSYVVALSANVLHAAGDKAGRNELLDKLVQLQEPNGAIKGATTSITGSGGEALTIETTALATLGWLTDQDYIDFADKGVKYLTEACKAGRFGSTQSTVLALQAIVEQDKALARPKSPGSLQLLVDGKIVGEPVKFDTNSQGSIPLPDMAARLSPGKHTVAVRMDGGSSMPHVVAIKLHTTQPDSSEACAVRIETSLNDATLAEGAVTEVRVRVSNKRDEAVPTPIAQVGIPGGLDVRHDQLKELVKGKKIAAYEVIGRNVVLYWREMTANQVVELPISLVAAIPGSYTGPASQAYLYYTDEHRQWADPLKVRVMPRTE